MRLTLLRRFAASPDGSEYWLARPDEVISYQPRGSSEEIDVAHVVVGPGTIGQSFVAGFKGRINLAYVTNPSLEKEDTIDFKKADYVAYGMGSVAE